MLTRRFAASILAAAGLAGVARAQAFWTTQMAFAQTTDGPAIAGGTFNLTATGVYTFIVRVGVFDYCPIPCQLLQGLNNWTATVGATGLAPGETLGVTPANSRLAPFTFGPATSFGGVLANPAAINNINCARDVSGGASAPWLWDTATNAPGPQPTVPVLGAVGTDSLTNVWRFTLTVNTFQGQDIVVHFSGSAGPVLQWSVFSSQPPLDANTPGIVHFIGLTPNPVLQAYPAANLTLDRCPADFDHNGAVQPADVALFVSTWLQGLALFSLAADFDHDLQLTPADVALFINVWFAGLANGC